MSKNSGKLQQKPTNSHSSSCLVTKISEFNVPQFAKGFQGQQVGVVGKPKPLT
jgi:hypothetical protein